MISVKGASFGRFGGWRRRYPGGSECRSIFLTVSRAMPNRLAASRWLRPSTWQASRTRRYRSTVYILPPSISKKIEGYRWQSFTPPAAGKSRRFRGLICHRRSQSRLYIEEKSSAPGRGAVSVAEFRNRQAGRDTGQELDRQHMDLRSVEREAERSLLGEVGTAHPRHQTRDNAKEGGHRGLRRHVPPHRGRDRRRERTAVRGTDGVCRFDRSPPSSATRPSPRPPRRRAPR